MVFAAHCELHLYFIKNIMLLLNEFEVHTRKYLFWHSKRMDRMQWGPYALDVRTNISRMDRNLG